MNKEAVFNAPSDPKHLAPRHRVMPKPDLKLLSTGRIPAKPLPQKSRRQETKVVYSSYWSKHATSSFWRPHKHVAWSLLIISKLVSYQMHKHKFINLSRTRICFFKAGVRKRRWTILIRVTSLSSALLHDKRGNELLAASFERGQFMAARNASVSSPV